MCGHTIMNKVIYVNKCQQVTSAQIEYKIREGQFRGSRHVFCILNEALTHICNPIEQVLEEGVNQI